MLEVLTLLVAFYLLAQISLWLAIVAVLVVLFAS